MCPRAKTAVGIKFGPFSLYLRRTWIFRQYRQYQIDDSVYQYIIFNADNKLLNLVLHKSIHTMTPN